MTLQSAPPMRPTAIVTGGASNIGWACVQISHLAIVNTLSYS